MAKEVDVHLFIHTSVAELTQEKFDEGELNYEHYHFHEPSAEKDMPLKWHEAQPCIGKRELGKL